MGLCLQILGPDYMVTHWPALGHSIMAHHWSDHCNIECTHDAPPWHWPQGVGEEEKCFWINCLVCGSIITGPGPAAEITLIKRHHCNHLNTNTKQTINYKTLSCSWSSAVTTKVSCENIHNDIKCKLTGAMCGEYWERDRGHFYASFQENLNKLLLIWSLVIRASGSERGNLFCVLIQDSEGLQQLQHTILQCRGLVHAAGDKTEPTCSCNNLQTGLRNASCQGHL